LTASNGPLSKEVTGQDFGSVVLNLDLGAMLRGLDPRWCWAVCWQDLDGEVLDREAALPRGMGGSDGNQILTNFDGRIVSQFTF
jgi:hypothetical protein